MSSRSGLEQQAVFVCQHGCQHPPQHPSTSTAPSNVLPTTPWWVFTHMHTKRLILYLVIFRKHWRGNCVCLFLIQQPIKKRKEKKTREETITAADRHTEQGSYLHCHQFEVFSNEQFKWQSCWKLCVVMYVLNSQKKKHLWGRVTSIEPVIIISARF